MFRPTKMTRLREWLARIIMPKMIPQTELRCIDTNKLGNLIGDTENKTVVRAFIQDVFDGAGYDFVEYLVQCIDEIDSTNHPHWDEASFGVPVRLTNMFRMQTKWVLWHKNGNVEVVDMPNVGGWDSDGSYVTYTPPEHPRFVSGVLRAAKVGTLADSGDNGTPLCIWQLYTL